MIPQGLSDCRIKKTGGMEYITPSMSLTLLHVPSWDIAYWSYPYVILHDIPLEIKRVSLKQHY